MKINKVGIIFKLLVVNGEGRERKALRRGRDSRPFPIHTPSTKTVRMFKLRPLDFHKEELQHTSSCSFFRSKESRQRKSHIIKEQLILHAYPKVCASVCIYDDRVFSSSCMISKKQTNLQVNDLAADKGVFNYKNIYPSPHPVFWRREKGKECFSDLYPLTTGLLRWICPHRSNKWV